MVLSNAFTEVSDHWIRFLIQRADVFIGKRYESGSDIKKRFGLTHLRDFHGGYANPCRKETLAAIGTMNIAFASSNRPYGKGHMDLLKKLLPGWRIHEPGCMFFCRCP